MNVTEYFYQNWLDKLVTIIGVILGVVSGVLILISKIGESMKSVKIASEDVKERGKELVESTAESKVLNEKLKEALEKLGENAKETKRLNDNFKSLKAKTEKDNETIRKALLIAFSSDSELVKTGRAEEITRILKGDEDEVVGS